MSINSFVFEAVNNGELSSDIIGVIDDDNRTVSLEVNAGTDLSALVPTITVCSGCILSPESGVAEDFNAPVNYTVTTPNGVQTSNWVVTVTKIYNVGDTGPAGGLVFYDKGSYSGDPSWRYLEAAPSDQSSGALWGCYGTPISGADGTSVGTGKQNTLDIVDIETGCATAGTAADICANFSLGDYDDWFLPSKDELNLMCTNLHLEGVGNFTLEYYWSSSEIDENAAWVLGFIIPYFESNASKESKREVRAVRAF